ncbi:MAG: glycosyltransferase [Lachnospiraceae bacterium]|nr:glycosyltransferase [Lachnospiraceae bacterium]
MKKTIIVMPVANEEATMGEIIEQILELPYDNLFLYLIIDSHSTDGTEEIIKSYEASGRVKCIFYKESKGVISCYLKGYRIALEDGAERIIEMDGGGSHVPSELPQYIEKLDEGYECVWGSRFIEGAGMEKDPLYRKILSRGGTLLSNLVLGTKLRDMTSGYEAFQRTVLEQFEFSNFLSTGHMYQTEMKYYCRRFKSIEVPIHYTAGKSSLKFKSVTEALHILFKLKNNEKKVWKDT